MNFKHINENDTLNIYLVSDSSGETVSAVSEAACKQFHDLKTVKYMWPMIRTKGQIDKLLKHIKEKPGIIIHTMAYSDIRAYLIEQCKKYKITNVCPMDGILDVIYDLKGMRPNKLIPGKHHASDNDYLRKIESINFTAEHDDGQGMHDYDKADIVILGVSRTSKSPTSFYLANRGYKVANLPIVKHADYYDMLKSLQENEIFIVGFTIAAERLAQIRINRFHEADNFQEHYVSLDEIREELQYANRLFNKLAIPVIDINSKAIEETAGEVISALYQHRDSHKI